MAGAYLDKETECTHAPRSVAFGTLRELTLGGSAANYDFGNANNNSCDTSKPNCWAPDPERRARNQSAMAVLHRERTSSV